MKVTANDGNGGSVSDEFDITVVDTTPPTLASATVATSGLIVDLNFSEAYAIPENLSSSSSPTLSPGTSP